MDFIDTLAETLDIKLREWRPDIVVQVRQQIEEIIELADQEALDILRSLSGYRQLFQKPLFQYLWLQSSHDSLPRLGGAPETRRFYVRAEQIPLYYSEVVELP